MKKKSPLQRFFEKVARSNESECWEWKGCKDGQPRTPHDDPKGRYGRFALDGSRMIAAHRASYLLFNGSIAPGMLVCHHCDNTGCVNPEHLFLGDAQANSDDKLKKGRSAHQKPGYVSPRKGTGNAELGRWTECFICSKSTYQRADSIRNRSKPVCSQQCKARLCASVRFSQVIVKCFECNTEISRIRSLSKRRNFCSRSCSGKAGARTKWHGSQICRV